MSREQKRYELHALVKRLIDLGHEGEWWDFKREWPSKEDLLYDIICLANNTQFSDAYLILGVDEEKGYSFSDVTSNEHRKNTQNITDFLKGQPFAGDYYPSVRVQELLVEQQTLIDVVVIEASKNAPYFLSKATYGIPAGAIPARTMDTNTPKGQSASYRQTEMLWRNHFGLTDSPLKRLKAYLLDPDGWQVSFEHSLGEKEFYTQFPEFTIEHISNDSLDGYEYYHFEQTDSSPHWYEILVRYHQTVIWGVQGASLDGGRYFTSVPERSFLHTPSHHGMSLNGLSYTYCYFVEGTLNHLMHKYFYRCATSDERIAYERFIRTVVFYESEDERMEIERLIEINPESFEKALTSITPYVYISDEHTETARTSYIESLKVVRFIQDELERFRDCDYPNKLAIKEDASED